MARPATNHSLHGFAPEHSPVALVLIDMINDFEFEGAQQLLRHAKRIVKPIAALKKKAKARGIPVIYVNDNFGKWQSDFRKLLEHCLEDDVQGREIARALRPDEDDYFVLKPKHSAFFSTTLEVLLDHLGTKTLILTGTAGDSCVLFTAGDAFMRDLLLVVPADCVASESLEENRRVLRHMARVLKADTRPSTKIDLKALKAGKKPPGSRAH